MIILNALYKKPEDPDKFKAHYNNVHMPLVNKIPGLEKVMVSHVSKVFAGAEDDYYMLAQMFYANDDTFNAAMMSPENKATGVDLANFAQAGVSLFVSRDESAS